VTIYPSAHDTAPACRPRQKSAGFTLIELMVAITMALFLAAGLVAVVFSMRSSFKTQDGLTQMQENSRFLLSVMNTTIHHAGYFTDPTTQLQATALPVPANANGDATTFAAGQFITGTTGANSTSDTLDVRFQTASGDGVVNCQGDSNTSGANVVYTNTFALNSAGQITCTVAVDGAAPGTAQVLVDNVALITMLFAVDTDGDGNPDTYQSASAVTAAGLWASVRAVQLKVTMKDLVNSTPATPVNVPTVLLHSISLMNTL
jgi:type IV pilus assembly protein PilW